MSQCQFYQERMTRGLVHVAWLVCVHWYRHFGNSLAFKDERKRTLQPCDCAPCVCVLETRIRTRVAALLLTTVTMFMKTNPQRVH